MSAAVVTAVVTAAAAMVVARVEERAVEAMAEGAKVLGSEEAVFVVG